MDGLTSTVNPSIFLYMTLIYVLLGVLAGGVVCWLGLRPYLKRTVEEDKRVAKENEIRAAELASTQQALSATNTELMNTRSVLATEKTHVANLHEQVTQATQEIDALRQEKDRLNETINFIHNQAATVKSNVQLALDQDLEKIRADYESARLAAEQEYIETVEQYSEQMGSLIEAKNNDLNAVNKRIDDAKQVMDSINGEKARAEAEQSLYMLSVTADDLVEIRALRDVSKTFRDATPVNKLIWSLYYQKPYKDLVLKTLGDKKTCGIYAITDTTTDKKYVGQSVDVATRWADHIKRGLGADKGADTKLYAAMKLHGVENFKFELLEEVPRERLNEQERFWIEYFDTTKIGLNTTKGNT